jgi:4-alpha-glucanotransferase
VFAGNPLLISLERLVQEGFLEQADLDSISLPHGYAEYDAALKIKIPLLRKSLDIFEKKAGPDERNQFQAFGEQNAWWLEDYALFMALREAKHFTLWNSWEPETRRRQPGALENWRQALAPEILNHKYQQFQFFRQWRHLREYCHRHGIKLIGDIPIFASLDSAEVWAHPELFFLDADGHPTAVAGVPPDYFSKTGQLWGNPLYRWNVMAQDDYAWWIQRLRQTQAMVDIIRLDHFRGFEAYWAIPATETTAINGQWVPGPRAEFFYAVRKALGNLPIIAEDLGIITPEVNFLRDEFGLPGMRVLQFAFAPDAGSDEYRPYAYPHNCVVYTGTHDNNTTIGWFQGDNAATTLSKEAQEKERRFVLKYLGTDGHEINWDFIRLALMSIADTAIIPLQDVFGLGSEARMNLPGTTGGNWRWRFTPDMLRGDIAGRLKEWTTMYGR